MRNALVFLLLTVMQAQAFTSTELLTTRVQKGSVECEAVGRHGLSLYNGSAILEGGLITQESEGGADAISAPLNRLQISQMNVIDTRVSKDKTETVFNLTGSLEGTYLHFQNIKFDCVKVEPVN